MDYKKRLLKSIPGGAHTYSRGFDQHPSNAPEILASGKGVYLFDQTGKKYLDYGMALRAVNLGYAQNEVDEAAITQIRNGTNLTLPTLIELEAAELIIDLIDSDSCVWEQEPLKKLVEQEQLMAYEHNGFWQPMDTLRDKIFLEDLWVKNKAPWKTW